MEKAAWIDALVDALSGDESRVGTTRLKDLAEQLWPQFGHIDPSKVALAARRVWDQDA